MPARDAYVSATGPGRADAATARFPLQPDRRSAANVPENSSKDCRQLVPGQFSAISPHSGRYTAVYKVTRVGSTTKSSYAHVSSMLRFLHPVCGSKYGSMSCRAKWAWHKLARRQPAEIFLRRKHRVVLDGLEFGHRVLRGLTELRDVCLARRAVAQLRGIVFEPVPGVEAQLRGTVVEIQGFAQCFLRTFRHDDCARSSASRGRHCRNSPMSFVAGSWWTIPDTAATNSD